uniref:Uncharacterized protein n=1 Tax=Zea mays TaxID=4577 RepID=C0PKG5_MAIZE|nr:unknown [Zea mays]
MLTSAHSVNVLSDLLKNVIHSLTSCTQSLQRNSLGHRQSAALAHVNLHAIDSVPVEALDEGPQRHPDRLQREPLSGALAPPHPKRRHEQPLGFPALEPLRHEPARLLPHSRVPVDRVHVHQQRRAARDVVAADLAVCRRLVREQQRRGGVQAQRLGDDAPEVAETRQVARVEQAGVPHSGVDLCSCLLECPWIVEQQRHGPFDCGRGRLCSSSK